MGCEKIYAALARDKTRVPDYCLEAELEQFLYVAIELSYEGNVDGKRAKRDF